MNFQIKKTSLIILLFIVCFSLFIPKQVYALGDEWATIGHFFSSVGEFVWKVGEKLWETAEKQFTAVVFKQGLNLYLGEMARQSAEYVATGGKGQKPAFISDPSYWKKAGDNLLGTFVNEVAQEGLGVKSLCDPIDPTIRFNMLVSVDTKYKEQKFAEYKMDICPLSRINERVKEASSKKLFEFSADVREGKPKKFKTNIKVSMVNDTVINKADGNFVCDKRGKFTWGLLNCACSDSCTTNQSAENQCYSSIGCDFQNKNMFGKWVNEGTQKLLNIVDKLGNVQDNYEKIINAYECVKQDKEKNPGWCTKKLEEIKKEFQPKQKEFEDSCPNSDDPEWCNDLQSEIDKLVKKFNHINEWSKEYSRYDIKKVGSEVVFDLKELIDENKTESTVLGIKRGIWGLKKQNNEWVVDSGKNNIDYLGWWSTYPAKCVALSKDDFYASQHCLSVSSLAFDDMSESKYQDAIAYSKRMNTYAKKITDWYGILEDMIDETYKAIEEEKNLPETDPLDEVKRITSPEGSDIGATMEMQSDFFSKQTEAMEQSKFFQSLQGRMNDVSTKISGITKTPSIYIDESTRAAIKDSSATYKQYTGAALADAFNIFSSTLMKKLMERAFEEGFNPQVEADRTKPFLDKPEQPAVSQSIEEVRDDFSDLKSAKIRKGGKMSIYDEFAVCLDNPLYQLPTNCLLDSNMIEAIENKMTIEQAIEKDLLNSGANVGSSEATDLFSYVNIKKLRRYRIFPLGMEIAAEKIYNNTMGNQEYNLGQIVDGFNKYNSINTCSTVDLNGSFENGTDSIPNNWEENSGDGTIEKSNDSYNGSFSYKITSSTPVQDAWYGIRHENNYDVFPNTQYTVSAMVKPEEITNNNSFNILLHCHSPSEGNFNYTTDDGVAISSSNDEEWTQIYKTFTTNNNATDCNFGLIFNNGGTGIVYVDSFNFVLGDQVPAQQDYLWESASPFCHLVDPDWVLKASTYQCDLMGYSAIPLKNSNQRQETCVDLKDCIHEDKDGNCDTWAYCTREKNVWKFNGTLCDKQYASCQKYVRLSDKKQFSYVSNTIDFDVCDENDNGCKWYCSVWDNDIGADGQWACASPGISNYPDNKSDDSQYNDENAIFFNLKSEDCKPENNGCNEYIKIQENINLIPNSGFEIDKDADDVADGWTEKWEGEKTLIEDSNNCFQGLYCYKFSHSIPPVSGDYRGIWQRISALINPVFASNPDYTGIWQRISVLPGQEYTVSAKIKVNTPITGDQATATVNYYWDEDGTGPDLPNIVGDTVIMLNFTDDWQNHFQTITAPNNMNYVWIAPIMYGDGEVYFDNIQLEYGKNASSYKQYGSGEKEYFKTIPKQRQWIEDGNQNWISEWKTCSVYSEEDDLYCDGYAEKCDAKDVGCNLYTNVKNNDSLAFVKQEQDECAPECVGYETFKQMPTNFDINIEWKSFIPSTAQGCYIPGCEEFTNLDTLNQGGEGTEYYSYSRQCVKIDEQDNAIIDSDSSEITPPNSNMCGYFYTWIGSETSGFQLKKYYLKIDDTDNGPKRVSNNPPSTWGSCENEQDSYRNPYCKQFYNESGEIYYRLYKNTITCSQDCYPYRRSANQDISMSMPSQGEMCNSQNNGCKEYKGPLAGDIEQVFSDDFTAGPGQWTTGTLSSETDNFLGYSLKQSGEGQLKRDVAGLIEQDNVYFVSFWAKKETAGQIEVSFSSVNAIEHNISLNNEWQNIKFGPFYFSTTPSNSEELMVFSTNTFYIDNVVLEKINDNIYLINNSWSTPTSCDIDYQGNYSQGYMIGCEKYVDNKNNDYYFKQFSKMCPEKAVGCTAYINTQNHSYPFEWEFNSDTGLADEITILKDSTEYYVVNNENYCHEINKGCQKLGLPEIDDNNGISMWSDVFIKNNPDNYKANKIILCDNNGVGCQAYSDNHYFKDPREQGKLCEYKETENKSGWFKTNTDQPCYVDDQGDPYMMDDGISYGIYFSGQENYNGMVGVCSSKQVGCTEFIDPGWGAGVRNLINNSDFGNETIGPDNDKHPDGWYNNFNDNDNWEIEVVNKVSVGQCASGNNSGNQCYSNAECETWNCSVSGGSCTGTSPSCQGSNKYCSNNDNNNNPISCTEDADCNTTTSTGTCTPISKCSGNYSVDCLLNTDCTSANNTCNIPSNTMIVTGVCEYDNSSCDPDNNQCPTVEDSCVGAQSGYPGHCYWSNTTCFHNNQCLGTISQDCEPIESPVPTGHCRFAVDIECTDDPDCANQGAEDCVFGTCSVVYDNCYDPNNNYSFEGSCQNNPCDEGHLCLRSSASCDPFGEDFCMEDGPCTRVGTCASNSNIECFQGVGDRCVYDYGVCGISVCYDDDSNTFGDPCNNQSDCQYTTNNYCYPESGECTQSETAVCDFEDSDSINLPLGMLKAYHVYTNNTVFEEAGFIGDVGSPVGGEFSYNGPAYYGIWAFVNKGTVKFGDLSKPEQEIVSISSDDSSGQWIKKSVFVSFPSSTRVYFVPDDNGDVDAYVTGLVLSPSSFAEYYYIDNNKLDKTKSDVSLKQGHILLKNSSNINTEGEVIMNYNSFATYQKSSKQSPPGKLVDPINCEPEPGIDCSNQGNQPTDYCKYCEPNNQLENDTNLILKVDRDRICGEWLSCISSNQEWDANLGAYRDVCQFMGRCNKLISSGESTACARFVEPEEVVLTEDVYKNRDISFSGMDYSGHSLHNIYPLEKLFLKEDSEGSNIYKLTHKTENGENGEDGIDGDNKILDKTCRLFPEKDSPFKNWSENVLYTGVNLCSDNPSTPPDDYSDCQCSYLKTKYGGMSFYYNYADTGNGNAPPKACIKGDNKGELCVNDNNCNDLANACVVKEEVQKVVGLRDYCIELDESKEDAQGLGACITWWPGAGLGDPDVFNQVPSAGYNRDAEYFCVDGNDTDRWEYRPPVYREGRYSDGYGCYNTSRPSSLNCNGNYIEEEEREGDRDRGFCWSSLSYHSRFWRGVYCDRIGTGVPTDSGWFNDNSGSSFDFPDNDFNQNIAEEEEERCNTIIKIASGNDAKAFTNKIYNNTNAGDITFSAGCGFYGNLETFLSNSQIVLPYSGFENDCSIQTAYTVGTSPPRSVVLSGSIIHSGTSDLQELFAQSEAKYEWNGTAYIPVDTYTPWDNTESATNTNKAPKVASKQEEGEIIEGQITIGDNSAGDIVRTAAYPAVLEFYAWANENQMPVRKIEIDWLGTEDQGIEQHNVTAKNHKPACDDESTFGDSSDTCIDETYKFNRIYTCVGSGSLGWNSSFCQGVSNACCFKPKVRIKDNWGWCTNGIYNCSDGEGWVSYNGTIIVNAQ